MEQITGTTVKKKANLTCKSWSTVQNKSGQLFIQANAN